MSQSTVHVGMVVCHGRTLYVRVDSRTGPDGSVRQRLIYLATAAVPCRAVPCRATRCGAAVRAPHSGSANGTVFERDRRWQLGEVAPHLYMGPPSAPHSIRLRATETADPKPLPTRPGVGAHSVCYAVLCCARAAAGRVQQYSAVFSSAGCAMYVRTQARHCNTSPRALRHTVVEQCNPYRPKEPARHNLAVLGARTLLARMACNIQRE